MADPLIVDINKGGVSRIQLSLIRSESGISMWAKAHKQIEAFMRDLTHGETADVKIFSRSWVPIEADAKLLIYTPTNERLPEELTELGNYTIDAVGAPLILPNSVVNISFLRIVGISEGDGISFRLREVHSTEALRDMQKRVGDAVKRFYSDYLRPVDLSVTISTQEVRY